MLMPKGDHSDDGLESAVLLYPARRRQPAVCSRSVCGHLDTGSGSHQYHTCKSDETTKFRGFRQLPPAPRVLGSETWDTNGGTSLPIPRLTPGLAPAAAEALP